MKWNALARDYGYLTAEERFRLILAASGRNDESERARLVRASGRISLSMPDYSPHAHAFHDLSRLIYLMLLEDAASHDDAIERRNELFEDPENCEPLDGKIPWHVELALVHGHILRVKADGWKLFCERMGVLPFLFWEKLPGFDRLQRALAVAESFAYDSPQMLRWLNAARPEEDPKLTEVPLTAEKVANAIEEALHVRVQWWGG